MSETRLKRKARKIVYKNLDNIYTVCRDIAKMWDKNTVPLNTLKTAVDNAKPNTNTGDEFMDLHNSRYIIVLDKFYEECVRISKTMDSKNIPVVTIKKGINLIKENYKNGQQKQINNSQAKSA